MRPADDCRYKIGYVSQWELMDLLWGPSGLSQPDEFPFFPGLPEGYEVQWVRESLARSGFAFLIYHPDWPALKQGEVIPEFHGLMRCVPRRIVEEPR